MNLQNARAVWGESGAQAKAVEEIIVAYSKGVAQQGSKDLVNSGSDSLTGRFAGLTLGTQGQ